MTFADAMAFDQPLDAWNVSSVYDMYGTFGLHGVAVTSFNQDIDSWDVAHVTNMAAMFYGASSFDRPLNSWDVRHVTTMYRMFLKADAFNQPLADWDVGRVTDMGQMFRLADKFNQPLGEWNLTSLNVCVAEMFCRAYSLSECNKLQINNSFTAQAPAFWNQSCHDSQGLPRGCATPGAAWRVIDCSSPSPPPMGPSPPPPPSRPSTMPSNSPGYLIAAIVAVCTSLCIAAPCYYRQQRRRSVGRSSREMSLRLITARQPMDDGPPSPMRLVNCTQNFVPDGPSAVGAASNSSAGPSHSAAAVGPSPRPASPWALPAEIPQSDITLGAELGRGGRGRVYAADWLGKAVAVKAVLVKAPVLPVSGESSSADEFASANSTMASCEDSKHVPPVVDAGGAATAAVGEMPWQIEPQEEARATARAEARAQAELTARAEASADACRREEQLLREAAMLARMRHPCICQVFGICRIDGSMMVVMEQLECSVHQLLHDRSHQLSVPLRLQIAHETAMGIAYLHRNTVMHRDIKGKRTEQAWPSPPTTSLIFPSLAPCQRKT